MVSVLTRRGWSASCCSAWTGCTSTAARPTSPTSPGEKLALPGSRSWILCMSCWVRQVMGVWGSCSRLFQRITECSLWFYDLLPIEAASWSLSCAEPSGGQCFSPSQVGTCLWLKRSRQGGVCREAQGASIKCFLLNLKWVLQSPWDAPIPPHQGPPNLSLPLVRDVHLQSQACLADTGQHWLWWVLRSGWLCAAPGLYPGRPGRLVQPLLSVQCQL